MANDGGKPPESVRSVPWRRVTIIAAPVGAVVAWIMGGLVLPSGLPAGIAFQGAVLGSLEALVALGIVLIYRANRIINFAQVEMGGIGSSVAILSVIGLHLPFFIAVLLGLAAALVSGVVVDTVVIRRFARAPRLILTAATVGLAQVFGAAQIGMPQLFSKLSPPTNFTPPFHVKFHLGSTLFNQNDLVIACVVPLVAASMWWFLARTDTGLAIRGAADSTERASLLGIPLRRLSLVTWVVASGLSGLGLILSATILNPNVGVAAGPAGLVVPLAAAAIGRMESMAVAFSAAIGIEIFRQAIFWSYPHSTAVDVGLFVFVVLAMLVQRRAVQRREEPSLGSFVALREVRPVDPEVLHLPRVRVAVGLFASAVVALVITAPLGMTATQRTLLAFIAIYGIIALSLVVLTGWAGQISLGQFAFVGVGAATTGALLVHSHTDLFLALAASTAIGALAAIVIGLPALRIPGLLLAVTTLAFALPVSTYLLSATYFPALTPPEVVRPLIFHRIDLASPLAFYYLCLTVLCVVIVLVANLRRSRPGRAIVAVRDNSQAAASFGIGPLRTKLTAFATSGAVAGLAGGLFVVASRGISYAGFPPEQSIVVFTMVVLGGVGSIAGAIYGAVYVESMLYLLSGGWQLLATGAGILLLLLVVPEGLGGLMLRARDQAIRTIAGPHAGDAATSDKRTYDAGQHVTSRAAHNAAIRLEALEDLEIATSGISAFVEGTRNGTPVLECTEVYASYDRTPALFRVSMSVEPGEIVALLGTNGAGKSTFLRAISGLLPTTSGSVRLSGVDIGRWTPAERAREGIVTVLSERAIFPSLTVAENVRLATWLHRGDTAAAASSSRRAYEIFPMLAERKDLRASLLSGGQQRMLALAQAIICNPKVLLIDELSMGIAPAQVRELVGVVRQIAASGVGVVVVEQSLNIAAAIAERAIFMERGRVRFSGPTPDLSKQPDVVRSVFLRAAAKSLGARQASGLSTEVKMKPDGSTVLEHGLATPALVQNVRAAPEGSEGAPALSVESAWKHFGGVAAVEDVSLRVDKGKILGVIGSNGSGKTVLLDICSGFLKPDRGRVHLGFTDVTPLDVGARARAGLGRVFQESGLFPSLTVNEALAVAFEKSVDVKDPVACMLRVAATARSEAEVAVWVDSLVEQMRLGRWSNSFLAELSTGTRRIVEIACAFAHDPSVLLLDEPSAGIAQRESEALGQLLLALRDSSGMSMIIVEHDLPLISSIADEMICMHVGRVIARGDTLSVLNNPFVIDAYLGEDYEVAASIG